MIEIEVVHQQTFPLHPPNTVVEHSTIQCESYVVEEGAVTFFRMRFVGLTGNPNEYFAVFIIPLHRIHWMSRRFSSGRIILNYDGKHPE